MKQQGYICDKCGNIFTEKFVKGVLPHTDMFNFLNSYPVCDPKKAEIHYCTGCYNEYVTVPVDIQVTQYRGVRETITPEFDFSFRRSLFAPKSIVKQVKK